MAVLECGKIAKREIHFIFPMIKFDGNFPLGKSAVEDAAPARVEHPNLSGAAPSNRHTASVLPDPQYP